MTLRSATILASLALGIATAPMAHAQTQWNVTVGGQTHDHAIQAFAFLPNEMWIHVGDRVTFKFAVNVPNTVTFLTADQIRLSDFAGCPGATPDPSDFDGTACVNSGPMFAGQSYTVEFPAAGNYKVNNLFHENETGTIHVIDVVDPLPHSQAWYDRAAKASQRTLLIHGQVDDGLATMAATGHHRVIAGSGSIHATAGGQQTVSVMRFMKEKVTIHRGETVEWVNYDPVTPHMVTFGDPPQGNPQPPSSNVTMDADGARHAIISSTADRVHSGFLTASGNERPGVPTSPLEVTRFRVTFTQPGIYPYMCVIHAGLGMRGTVVVLP